MRFPAAALLSTIRASCGERRRGGGRPGRSRSGRTLGSARALSLGAALVLSGSGCCWLTPYRTPTGISRWQDPKPPTLSLTEKASRYQSRLERLHATPEGVIRYRRDHSEDAGDSYGNLADGCFHTGVYLASQALRHAATGDADALAQVERTLHGLETLMEVTGKHGLLARHVSPIDSLPRLPAEDWAPSTTLPDLCWRGDASKDQYAGFIHGLGVTLALVDDASVRTRIGALAAAAADHLMENDFLVIDVDGEQTTYGNLRRSEWGYQKGTDALIVLAIAKVAAVATGASTYRDFYDRLIADGWAETAYWASAAFPGSTRRVNQNLTCLAVYPLLLLEGDGRVLNRLRRGARRNWARVHEEHNAFAAFIHAAVVGDAQSTPTPDISAVARGRRALLEFPERKIEWPVDLTRPGFDFPRALVPGAGCTPRSRVPIPLYLRTRGSFLWVSDPYRLVGRLQRRGNLENAGVDYLVAYWLGRHHGALTDAD